MRALVIVTVIVLLTVVQASVTLGQLPSITIDQIIADKHILGIVSGLPVNDYPKYKVIVYIHTDQWYIHPYAGQDEGRSWASVTEKGEWRIETVRREFRADKAAALLVEKDYSEPNVIGNIDEIPSKARVIKDLKETSDYGKL
jgi:hypothetical protein